MQLRKESALRRMAHVSRVGEIARYYGVAEKELLQWIDEGALPYVPASAEILIHESDLMIFFAEREQKIPRRRRLRMRPRRATLATASAGLGIVVLLLNQ